MKVIDSQEHSLDHRRNMSGQKPTKQTETSALLNFDRPTYSYVQLSDANTPSPGRRSAFSSPNRHCRICDESGNKCQCSHHPNHTELNETPRKHKFATSLLLLITFFLTVAILGSALLLRRFNIPTAEHNNPLLMSVFLDNESTRSVNAERIS